MGHNKPQTGYPANLLKMNKVLNHILHKYRHTTRGKNGNLRTSTVFSSNIASLNSQYRDYHSNHHPAGLLRHIQ